MKTSGAKPTRQMVREVVHMMMKDETLGIRAHGSIYTVSPLGSSRFLAVREKTPQGLKVGTMFLGEFIDLIYGFRDSAKVVRI